MHPRNGADTEELFIWKPDLILGDACRRLPNLQALWLIMLDAAADDAASDQVYG